uniref:Uncharacterized protein n=1 Tax=Corethrella appendiculata TaxID=1370023 RepID=U5ETC5_9DIPT
MTLYRWTHWFWITLFGVITIECTPLGSVDTFSTSKLSPKGDENSNNKITYLKRGGELNSKLNPAAAIPILIVSSTSTTTTTTTLAPDVDGIYAGPSQHNDQPIFDNTKDVDDIYAGGSINLAEDADGEDRTKLTNQKKDTTTTDVIQQNNFTRFNKNDTIFTRNSQNITTLKLKNYQNSNKDSERLQAQIMRDNRTPKIPDMGEKLVNTLRKQQDQQPPDQLINTTTDSIQTTSDIVTNNSSDQHSPSPVDTTTESNDTLSEHNNNSSRRSNSDNSSNNNSSNSNHSDNISDNNNDNFVTTISPDFNPNNSNSIARTGKILTSEFHDDDSLLSASSSSLQSVANSNLSNFISKAIAFTTQHHQEGIDDDDHPLDDEDTTNERRVFVVNHNNLNVGAISGICLASLGLLSGISAAGIIVYRRYIYLNKPQTLSEPDSSGYIDDSTIRDNSDEMYSLDNDSFLNSLEAMTIQNYWTDNVKHTKL